MVKCNNCFLILNNKNMNFCSMSCKKAFDSTTFRYGWSVTELDKSVNKQKKVIKLVRSKLLKLSLLRFCYKELRILIIMLLMRQLLKEYIGDKNGRRYEKKL